MHLRTFAVPLALLLALAGCTDLKVVRDFARESSALARSADLTERYRDTYRREQPYLDPGADAAERATDARRQAVIGDIMRIHQTLGTYLETLGRLAGGDPGGIQARVAALQGTIASAPPLDASQAEAYGRVAGIVARYAMARRQARAVREMIQEGDPPIQKLIAGTRALVGIYRRTHENEKALVLGVFETQLPFTRDPRDLLLNRLARAQQQAKAEEYRKADVLYQEADQALAAMAEGHRRLLEGLSAPSGGDAALDEVRRSIRTMRESAEGSAMRPGHGREGKDGRTR